MTTGALLPTDLITSNDSEEVRGLFAEVLAQAEEGVKRAARRSVAMPGPFWLLARKDPSLDELQAYWEGVAPPGWPAWFERNLQAMRQDPLRDAFAHCLNRGPERGVSSGGDLCRLMGAVAQTLYSTNLAIIRRNRALAGSAAPYIVPGDEWSNEALFVSRRPDELGGHLETDGIALWMGCHVGPEFADKLENQDAVCALKYGAGLVFSLADGVSTSLGSRFAAALAAHRFCCEMKRLCEQSPRDGAMLVEAARRTQRGMDELLERMLADPGGAEMEELLRMSSFKERTAGVVLWNTKTAEKAFLQPALATTLIGGFIEPTPWAGEFYGAVICVGDGAVERIGQDGSVVRVFATDPGVTGICASMGPGPRSLEALEGDGILMAQIALCAGEHLLISSDGLARGHEGSIWSKIENLMGDIRPRLTRGNRSAAADLLRDLASAAEAAHPDGDLFDDNLSLILVTAR